MYRGIVEFFKHMLVLLSTLFPVFFKRQENTWETAFMSTFRLICMEIFEQSGLYMTQWRFHGFQSFLD